MAYQPDESTANLLDTLVAIVTANILWILTSIPIVTLPAATGGS